MSEQKKKILEMLAKNKISADEAYKLINAVEADETGSGNEKRGNEGHDNTGHDDSVSNGSGVKRKPRYLRVTVTPGEDHEDPKHADRVNVRIPMALVRAGIKLTALIPPEALDKANHALRDKGINFDVRNIKPEDLEELIDALGDMQVDVQSARGDNVKVFVE
jgi:hypothetical protein